MKRSLIVTLLATTLVTACSKHDDTVTNTPPPSETVPAQPATTSADNAPPTPPSGEPVAMPSVNTTEATVPAPENGDMGKTLGNLSMRVRSYIVSTHRIPRTFEEFVASNPNLQVPPPPAGKKYSFDRKMKVILVNR